MTAAELTARKGGDRHPWDWYVEEPWVTHRLLDFVELEPHVTYLDPACGLCHIPAALADRGFKAFGTDLFRRSSDSRFLGEHDFLGAQIHMLEALDALSIVMNPPFSCQDGKLVPKLAEKFVRRALGLATHKVAALLPLKWLASKGRYRLFSENMPAGIYVLSERPSMPPGDKIAQLGPRCAYKRGKVDYVWILWDKNTPALPYAPTFFIPPREAVPAQGKLAIAA